MRAPEQIATGVALVLFCAFGALLGGAENVRETLLSYGILALLVLCLPLGGLILAYFDEDRSDD
jgi:hypothetical protein